MKKISFITTLFLCSNSFATSPYVVLEAQDNNFSYESPNDLGFNINPDEYYKNELRGGAISLGIKANDSLSVEVGYFKGEDTMYNNNTNLYYTDGPMKDEQLTTISKIGVDLISLDTLNYYRPDNTNISIFGLLGISYSKFEFNERFNDGSTYSDKESGLGVSMGFGFSYKLSDNFSLRTKAKYTILNDIKPTRINGISEVKDIFRFGAGLRVDF